MVTECWLWLCLTIGFSFLPLAWGNPASSTNSILAPVALVATPDQKSLFVACAGTSEVKEFDPTKGEVIRSIPMPLPPSGIALAPRRSRLIVTCAAPESRICIVDLKAARILSEIPAGHTAQEPVIDPQEERLYVCNRFDHSVSVVDLTRGRELARIQVSREPMAAALIPDGKRLLVANGLHAGRADVDTITSVVSVIDTERRRVVGDIPLPNGSGLLRGLRLSPDGRYAALTHLVARFQLPTTQLDRGWINNNALTLIDLVTMNRVATVLLDSPDRGAANPWAVAWSQDGRQLCVTHAGTYEASLIDFPAFEQKLLRLAGGATASGTGMTPPKFTHPFVNDLAFLAGLRQRIPLPGQGHRSMIATTTHLWIAEFFSDSLAAVDLQVPGHPVKAFALAPLPPLPPVRRGEMLFNDAVICFQGWQSCASCHAEDGRVDGLNWDLLNDGIGSPKNAKSLLLSHLTPPAMSIGIRESAEIAVRAGIRNSLFAFIPEADAVAMDEFIKSLKPIPSPHLVKGRLSAAAERGRRLFLDPDVGCATCHPPGLFTNLGAYNVGTRGRWPTDQEVFDTPTLIELWRTGPYLHDGSAATVREVVTRRNPLDQHGKTSQLNATQIDNLVAYLLSL
jgi:YVTN family beta-propeller protein